MDHLWDVKHGYYCEESNFFAKGMCTAYGSWADFHHDQGGQDMDLNLLFRWDWEAPRAGDGDGPIEWLHDENYRESTLKLFFMNQRKGIYRSVFVSACRADELDVIEYLKPRLAVLMGLWSPLT